MASKKQKALIVSRLFACPGIALDSNVVEMRGIEPPTPTVRR